MIVKDLKEILAGIDDCTEVVIEGSDHSYRKARAFEDEAWNNDGDLYEYCGPGSYLVKTDKRVNVVVFR